MNSPDILDDDLDLGQLLPADPLKGYKLTISIGRATSTTDVA
jgi:hypothetical protein